MRDLGIGLYLAELFDHAGAADVLASVADRARDLHRAWIEDWAEAVKALALARLGRAREVDWTRFDLEQFRAGMDVELEHGSHDPQTDVTGDDPIITGKIALAHMKEFPDYYERLERMEREAERDWETKS